MKNITKIILKHILRKNEEKNFPILGQKSWVNPFVINPKWRFLPKVFFIAWEGVFYIRNIKTF